MTPTMTLATCVPHRCWDGVTIPTGHLPDWPDLYDAFPSRCHVVVTVTTPDGTVEPDQAMTAYRCRDGDWFLPFVRVLHVGTIVRVHTPQS